MGASGQVSASFSDFFYDPSYTGHFFLEPSIAMGRAFDQILFTKLESQGCSAVAEVIGRAALFIIFSVLTLFAVPLLLIGLPIKFAASFFSDPTSVPPALKPSGRTGASIPEPERTGDDPIDDDSTDSPDLPDPIAPPGNNNGELEGRIAEANGFLELAENILDGVQAVYSKEFNPRKINIELVNEAKELLNHGSVHPLLFEVPDKQNGNSQLDQLVSKHELLSKHVEHLERLYHFYSIVAGDENEIKIADDGECLFASFLRMVAMNDPDLEINDEVVEQIRVETNYWIKAHYADDQNLQMRLVNSLAEHFQTKLERLEREAGSLEVSLTDPDLEGAVIKGIQNNIPVIKAQMANIQKFLPSIYDAIGKAQTDGVDFELAAPYVDEYLAEVLNKGVHGGAAELYALSQRYEYCVKIHAKTIRRTQGRVTADIAKVPYDKMGEEFETPERPALCFTHTDNHYNAYVPT